MQLGKKSKTTNMFEQVKGELGAQAEESAPLASSSQITSVADRASSTRVSASMDRDAICATVAESISARISRDGALKSFNVKGDLQLRISDATMTKVKLEIIANASHNAQFKTHPNVDKVQFTNSKIIQLKDPSRGFPANNVSVGVLRWSASAPADSVGVLPITFTVWVNKGSDDSHTITIEYEMTGSDDLHDVVMTIPYSTSEPAISSFDAQYEVSGDSLEWTIGTVDESSAAGSFEFEAQADDEAEFFPMSVRFSKSKPFVDVDVSQVSQWAGVSMGRLRTNIMPGIISHIDGDGSGCAIHERYQVCSRLVFNRMIHVFQNSMEEPAAQKGQQIMVVKLWHRFVT